LYAVPTPPLASAGCVVMARLAVMVRLNDLVVVSDVLSVACAVKLKVPPDAGVPVIAPEAFKAKPPGRAPAVIVQEYGCVPPDAFSVAVYATPAEPTGRVGAVMMVRPVAVVSVNALLAETEALSVTCTVKPKLPELVGVPVMAPEFGSRVSPPGKAPAVMEKW
jgi:hypothetical protein